MNDKEKQDILNNAFLIRDEVRSLAARLRLNAEEVAELEAAVQEFTAIAANQASLADAMDDLCTDLAKALQTDGAPAAAEPVTRFSSLPGS
jgi:energy-converting hydrogenase A subunit M